jgi:type II secretory pathway predicted ATPase ExeA
VLLGQPGTGKSVIKQALREHDPKLLLTPTVNRMLHTYHSVLRILYEAFSLTTECRDFKCEARLIAQADKINKQGKMLAPIIDDAHLMEVDALRRLRLVFEDFPKNHNLILIAQPELLSKLNLAVNDDLRSRVTYSVLLQKLAPDDAIHFILQQLDKVALGHNTFTDEALGLIARSSDGIVRRIRNLAIAAMMEAVRDRTKTVDLPQVNRVLLQPHWRRERDLSD